MKIAIVCDWLVTIGGAEKFLYHLLQCFPQADLFAVIDFIDEKNRHLIHHKPVTTTFIQKLPFAKTQYRNYLPFMPLAIEQLDVSSYDLILSSSHAVAKGVLTGSDQLHISYVHSPVRYAWDLQHQYLKETGLAKKWYGWAVRYYLHKLRLWDLRSAHTVNHFIANSHFIARRIQKIYGKTAEVIHPPIETSQLSPDKEKENFYLTASRLVPYKKIDMIVEAFQLLPDKKLIVIGEGPDFQKIKAKAGSNVTMLGYQSNEILIHYLKRAKAFLFAAYEDFGLLPLEAQACGTPVIAFGKGGVLETVIPLGEDQPTGLFFDEQTPIALCQAIQKFEAESHFFKTEYCLKQAAQFNETQFQTKFKAYVAEKMSLHNE